MSSSAWRAASWCYAVALAALATVTFAAALTGWRWLLAQLAQL